MGTEWSLDFLVENAPRSELLCNVLWVHCCKRAQAWLLLPRCASRLVFPPFQGTHKSLKGNSHALATVTAIIDGTGSVGEWIALGPRG